MQEPARPGEHRLPVPDDADEATALQRPGTLKTAAGPSTDEATTLQRPAALKTTPALSTEEATTLQGPGALSTSTELSLDDATAVERSPALPSSADRPQTTEATAVQPPPALARSKRKAAPRPASPPGERVTFRRRTTQMVKAVNPIYPVLVMLLIAVLVLQLVVGYVSWLREGDEPEQVQKRKPGLLDQFLPGQTP